MQLSKIKVYQENILDEDFLVYYHIGFNDEGVYRWEVFYAFLSEYENNDDYIQFNDGCESFCILKERLEIVQI